MKQLPIVKYSRWYYRANPRQVSCCSLETFIDPRGVYSILVTELGDNPGLSVTNSHATLLKAISRELKLPDDLKLKFYEQYDRNSYAPPRDDLNEISQIAMKDGVPHWYFVPEDEWEVLYINPQRPRPKTIRRKAEAVTNDAEKKP